MLGDIEGFFIGGNNFFEDMDIKLGSIYPEYFQYLSARKECKNVKKQSNR
jgi:hypothetical protein